MAVRTVPSRAWTAWRAAPGRTPEGVCVPGPPMSGQPVAATCVRTEAPCRRGRWAGQVRGRFKECLESPHP